jgi:PAS domain S-box-containing protein
LTVALKDMPIRQKLMAVNLLTSGVVILLACTGFTLYEFVTLHRNMITSDTTRAQIIAANSTASLAFQDQADAAGVLGALKIDRRMTEACLYDSQGKIFATYPAGAPASLFPTGPGESGYRAGHLDIFCPVVQGDRKLGTVYIQSNLSALTDRYQAYAWLSVGIIAGSILVAFLLSRLLGRQISRPILSLAETARAVSRGDFSARAHKFGEDELGLLTQAFNQMLTKILGQDLALAERTLLLDMIMRSMNEGIVVADQQGKMTFFNPAAERIVGLGMSTQDSSKWAEEYGVFREDKVTHFPEEEIALVRAVHGFETEDQVQFLKNPAHPEGIFINVNGRPLKDEKENVRGGLVVVRDIMAQRQVDEMRREYTRALEVSNKELQDFVFVASHDLQEPLRKIQAFGEFLRDEFKDVLGENGRDYIERMRGAASRMQRLINDLLALTRVTTKALPFEPVDLSKVLQDVLSDLETRVHEKNAKVEVGKLPTLEADPTQMRQLFQNLIGNALKFQKPGVTPEVRVHSTVLNGGAQNRCRITVEDNGIGFDNKYGQQIFKVFERLHGKDEYEGTGIGLAVCRKVVERHGGTIRAEGVPGTGATFTVELPIHQKRKDEK